MTIDLRTKCDAEDIKKKVLEAWASGERYIIRTEEGLIAAIIPMEDLAVLEEIERESSSQCGRLWDSNKLQKRRKRRGK